MGGHSLPVDPFYLTWKAREYDMATEFIELAGKVNRHMPYLCLEKIVRILNDSGMAVSGARALIIGLAYEAAVSDMRSSPALKILHLLRHRGASVTYNHSFARDYPSSDFARRRSPRRLRGSISLSS